MKIGMICPYAFDVPGGVQAHVVELAQVFIESGHEVSVLAPVGPGTDVPSYVVSAGAGLALDYNGSVSRINFGPKAYRTLRRWIATEGFDVLHVHEPNAPSVSMLSLMTAAGPIVTTFHTSTTKSLWLSIFQNILRPYHEQIRGKIAVSELARQWQMEALGSDAVEIPNGIHVDAFAAAQPLDGYPHPGKTVLFLGRYDEPRKGLAVLLAALPRVLKEYPDLRVLVVGGGREKALRRTLDDTVNKALVFLGQVDDATKARALASAEVYCAPNLGGESFGIVLVEAMAAGACVVASDLDAFRRVLQDGKDGELVPVGDSDALAQTLITVLGDDAQRAATIANARERADTFDWSRVAAEIMRVYETVAVDGETVRLSV